MRLGSKHTSATKKLISKAVRAAKKRNRNQSQKKRGGTHPLFRSASFVKNKYRKLGIVNVGDPGVSVNKS